MLCGRVNSFFFFVSHLAAHVMNGLYTTPKSLYVCATILHDYSLVSSCRPETDKRDRERDHGARGYVTNRRGGGVCDERNVCLWPLLIDCNHIDWDPLLRREIDIQKTYQELILAQSYVYWEQMMKEMMLVTDCDDAWWSWFCLAAAPGPWCDDGLLV